MRLRAPRAPVRRPDAPRSCSFYIFAVRALTLLVVGVIASPLLYLWRSKVLNPADAVGLGQKLTTLRGGVISEAAAPLSVPGVRAPVLAIAPAPIAVPAIGGKNGDAWSGAVPRQGVGDTRVRNTEDGSGQTGSKQQETDASSSILTLSKEAVIIDDDAFVGGRARNAAAKLSLSSKFSPDAPMRAWIAAGGRFPVLLVTCDRADELRATLQRLLSVRGVEANDVLVVGDTCTGDGARDVQAVALSAGVTFHRNPRNGPIEGADGAARIAAAYGYALKYALY